MAAHLRSEGPEVKITGNENVNIIFCTYDNDNGVCFTLVTSNKYGNAKREDDYVGMVEFVDS